MSTVREQIGKIIERQYGGYRGRKLRGLMIIHSMIWFRKTDEEFLEFLQNAERENPRPTYMIGNSKKQTP